MGGQGKELDTAYNVYLGSQGPEEEVLKKRESCSNCAETIR